ncbi:carbohydrate ABC transporter permease [Chloroflexia bacterium SDU3-3]|nr:carbohydrate ABC transporter permease [Chloroflexia bacterium SDU3-3]
MGAAAPATRRRLKLGSVLVGGLIALLLVIQLYPIIWLLLSSVKAPKEFNLRPIYALPEGFYWQNYADAWTRGNMSTYFRNSIIVTIPSLALIILASVAAAFALEIMRWRLQKLALMTFLVGIMVPMQIVILPLFTIYYNLHLINNLLGLILTYTAFGLPLTVFLFSGYIKPIPLEVIESAVVDGANIYQVFFRIVIPMLMNAIVTVALVQFFFIWNDLVLSMTFVNETSLRTIQTGLLNFVGQYGQRQWGPTFAGIAMAVIPILVIYMLMNNLVIRGLTSGAVKG